MFSKFGTDFKRGSLVQVVVVGMIIKYGVESSVSLK